MSHVNSYLVSVKPLAHVDKSSSPGNQMGNSGFRLEIGAQGAWQGMGEIRLTQSEKRWQQGVGCDA